MSQTQTQTQPRFVVDERAAAHDDIYSNARSHADRIAVRVSDGSGGWRPVTCAGLADEVAALSAGLIAAGISAGDRVVIMSRTRYEWMVADYAILSIGAITVPIYETSSDSQMEWILSDSGAVAAFAETSAQSVRMDKMRGRLPALRHVWTFDELAHLAADGVRPADAAPVARREAIRSHDVATIVYTSGTTGRPKGCMLSHANIVATVANIAAADGVQEFIFNEEQSTLLFLPLAHILARIIQCSAIHQRVTLGHLADMRAVPDGLASFQPTVVLSVPRVFEKIYNAAQHKAGSGLTGLRPSRLSQARRRNGRAGGLGGQRRGTARRQARPLLPRCRRQRARGLRADRDHRRGDDQPARRTASGLRRPPDSRLLDPDRR
jgi:long-chain acyl-CoA synthetase